MGEGHTPGIGRDLPFVPVPVQKRDKILED
jgi:hypothetical protein